MRGQAGSSHRNSSSGRLLKPASELTIDRLRHVLFALPPGALGHIPLRAPHTIFLCLVSSLHEDVHGQALQGIDALPSSLFLSL